MQDVTDILTGLPAGSVVLLLAGLFGVLTAAVHLLSRWWPLPASRGRDIFRPERAHSLRWLTGATSPVLSLVTGCGVVLLTSLAGLAVRLAGVQVGVLAGPVPGLLVSAWALTACVRRLRHAGGVQVVLSACASLLLTTAAMLSYLVLTGWGR